MLSRRRMSRTSWIGCRSTTAIESYLALSDGICCRWAQCQQIGVRDIRNGINRIRRPFATWGAAARIFLNIEARLGRHAPKARIRSSRNSKITQSRGASKWMVHASNYH